MAPHRPRVATAARLAVIINRRHGCVPFRAAGAGWTRTETRMRRDAFRSAPTAATLPTMMRRDAAEKADGRSKIKPIELRAPRRLASAGPSAWGRRATTCRELVLALAVLAWSSSCAGRDAWSVARSHAPADLRCKDISQDQTQSGKNLRYAFRGCGRYAVYDCVWSSGGGAECQLTASGEGRAWDSAH